MPPNREPFVEICPFGPGRPPRIGDIAELHETVLPTSPIVLLGRQFMERFYYSRLPLNGAIFGFVAYVDLEPAGFVVAASDSAGFLWRNARRHFLSIAWITAWSCLKSPSRVARVWEAIAIVKSRRQSAVAGDSAGEILSIGVLPQFRSGSERAPNGTGIAKRLLARVMQSLAERGCREVITVADADNGASQALFRSAGFEIRNTALEGWSVPSVEMTATPKGAQSETIRAAGQPGALAQQGEARTPVTIIVPCYNEEPAIPYLAACLAPVRLFPSGYDFRFIFVDDGSCDGTTGALRREFASWPGCRFIRHDRNRGLAAAMQTGMQSADTEIAGCIDCDCSYDPRLLIPMLRLLEDGVDMVTASPYHPRGRVVGVPGWRLLLSRMASLLHGFAAGEALYTYTSCFRVWKRGGMEGVEFTAKGFLGVAEMLDVLLLRGGRVLEYPAALERRVFGQSSLRTTRTAAGHIFLLGRILLRRMRGRGPVPGVANLNRREVNE